MMSIIRGMRANGPCHRHDHEREEEKIEGVECPPQEASQERVSLIAVERFEEPHRFHGALHLTVTSSEVETKWTRRISNREPVLR